MERNTQHRFTSSRENVLEAIEVMGSSGATYEELFTNVYADVDSARSGRQSLSRVLNFLCGDGLVIEHQNRYYLKDFAPHPASNGAVAALTTSANGTVSQNTRKREGVIVEVYTSPQEYENVVQVTACINGQWFKLPLFGSLKICLGPDIPTWSEGQESNQGISAIRVYQKDGKVAETQTNPRHWVTLDRIK
jgi:hypothetical protein